MKNQNVLMNKSYFGGRDILKKIKIAFRVDGSNSIGMGHVMRCIALAREFDIVCNSEILFIMKDFKEAVDTVRKNFEVKTISKNLGNNANDDYSTNIINKFKPEIIVTDILDIGENILLNLKNNCDVLVSIDDLANTKFCSDVVINGHFYSNNLQYRDFKESTYLLGPSFLILDKAFLSQHVKMKSINKNVKTILVTLGGSDDTKSFLKVIRGINLLEKNYDICMIIGPAFIHYDELDNGIKNSKHQFIVETKVDSRRMSELMFNTDVAIVSGGNTKYELVATGTPGLVICSNMDEVNLTDKLARKGCIINLGLNNQVNENELAHALQTIIENKNLRKKMSDIGKKEVDGMGTHRVVASILSKLHHKTLIVHKT